MGSVEAAGEAIYATLFEAAPSTMVHGGHGRMVMALRVDDGAWRMVSDLMLVDDEWLIHVKEIMVNNQLPG